MKFPWMAEKSLPASSESNAFRADGTGMGPRPDSVSRDTIERRGHGCGQDCSCCGLDMDSCYLYLVGVDGDVRVQWRAV